MVTTVTLNPCIDRTLFLPRFMQGGFNLIESERFDAGGKGVNAAIALKALGIEVSCTGISFDGNGSILSGKLDELEISHDFVFAPGNIRTNIKVTDLSDGRMTELNSEGDKVDESIINATLEKLSAYARKSEIVVISGRIPKGADTDIYKRCVEAVYPSKVLLDAEKEPLRLAVTAKQKPYIIRINTRELNEAFGYRVQSKDEVVFAGRELVAGGVKIVCVSMGKAGAVIADASGAFYAPAIKVDTKGLQGAGDSMAAGLCKALLDGGDISDMLRSGVAAATATVIREGTLLCRRADYETFLSMVKLEKI